MTSRHSSEKDSILTGLCNTSPTAPTTLFFRSKALGQLAAGPKMKTVAAIAKLEPQATIYYPAQAETMKLILFLQYPSYRLAQQRLIPLQCLKLDGVVSCVRLQLKQRTGQDSDKVSRIPRTQLCIPPEWFFGMERDSTVTEKVWMQNQHTRLDRYHYPYDCDPEETSTDICFTDDPQDPDKVDNHQDKLPLPPRTGQVQQADWTRPQRGGYDYEARARPSHCSFPALMQLDQPLQQLG